VIGSFGKVFKAKHKKGNKVYALKQITKEKIKNLDIISQIMREIKIMTELNHPNIVKLFFHFEEQGSYFLVLEYAEKVLKS